MKLCTHISHKVKRHKYILYCIAIVTTKALDLLYSNKLPYLFLYQTSATTISRFGNKEIVDMQDSHCA